MGFFNSLQKQANSPLKGLPIEVLRKRECQVCPLNRAPHLRHPKMPPAGAKHPLIYMLGEAPGADEDRKGEPFVGRAGRVLRLRIPKDWLPYLRWNNVIRTRPPNNREPSPVEIECCRPSIERDIATTKPVAIFGFGNVPLRWALDQSVISNWCGRRIPVEIGGHRCWYYPMLHPSGVMRTRRFEPSHAGEYGSDKEFGFAKDLERAFAEVDAGLPEPIVHDPKQALSDIEIITGSGGWNDVNRIEDALHEADEEGRVVGLDLETKGFRPYNSDNSILTVALSSQQRTIAFPLDHPGNEFTRQQREEVWELFKVFLQKARCRKVVHQLSFEMEWLAFFFGRKILRSGKWGCSVSQAFILDERQDKMKQGPQSLNFLVLQYFGLHLKKLSPLDKFKLAETPLVEVLRYNGGDSKYHRLLYLAQAKRLKEEGLSKVYGSHLRRIPTMVLTQMAGVPVDQKRVEQYYSRYTKQLQEIAAKIADLPIAERFKQQTGKDFRPSAERDLRIAFQILRIAVEKVDEKMLAEVDHPLAKLVVEWRKANKIRGTYVLPLRKGAPTLYEDGLLHPIMNTTRTRTWRTSSDGPNIQNFPKRKDKHVRCLVRPGGDLRIVSFDYGAIQARNVAMESRDKVLIKSFWDRYDIHLDWTERLVRIYPQWLEGGAKSMQDKAVRKKARDLVKNQFVFPSFFGAQPSSTAKYLGVPEKYTERLQDDFYGLFSGVHSWHKRLKDSYYKYGYVTGYSGFRRRAPITPNELINAPIQADESVIVCAAMSKLSEMGDPRFQARLEIHDDLTFIWPRHEIERNAEVVIEAMLMVPFEWAHIVPLAVEMSVGMDWASGEEVGSFFSDQWDRKVPYDRQGESKELGEAKL